MQEYALTSRDGGGRLYLRRKVVSPVAASRPPLLLVHGSTLPGSVVFDMALSGVSCMDWLARAGRDVWSLDIRGYGRSTVNASQLAAGDRCIIADTAQAVEDVTDALETICTIRHAEQVDLLGWSWGATVCAALASRCARRIRTLVMLAPQWLRDTPSPLVNEATLSEAFRRVEPERFVEHWFRQLSSEAQSLVSKAAWPQAIRDGLASHTGQPMQVPNGSVHDIARYWMAEKPFYEPRRIGVPTLVAVGDADTHTPPASVATLYSRIASPNKRFDLLPDGSHFLILEPVRVRFFESVESFLTHGAPVQRPEP